LGEEGEVAAGGLGAALDDVTGRGGAREGVEVRTPPTEVGDGRTDDDRGVGDPPGDDDVGAGGHGPGDAEAAEIGVRTQRCTEPELGRARGEVVTADVGDGGGEA